MNAHRLSAWLLGVALATASSGCFADDAAKPAAAATPAAPAKPAMAANPAPAAANTKPAKAPEPVKPPDEAKLRATLTKSLAFLVKENESWMEEKGCNSCHHLPELIWTHREAKRRGFAVDQKKFEEWLAWANNEAPKKAGGSQEAAFLLLANPEQSAPAVVKTVLAEQRPDGSFPSQGQFSGAQQRGKADADVSTLRVFLLALATVPDAKSEADAALAKAAALLQKKDPPTTVESLVFRVLFAEHFGKPQEADALRAQILKLQRGDGGWSYIIGTNQSDPWATGEALFVLHASSDPKTADAVARAQNWLVSQQGEDGSWPLGFSFISKGDRSGPDKAKSRKDATRIYTTFATDWATLGLLQGVPLANPAPAVANAKPAKAPEPVKPPAEATRRAGITKGLGFLAKEGDVWIADQKCNSCHHLPGLLWSHREAKRRGFAIDDKKFNEWLTWSSKEASKPSLDEIEYLFLAMPGQRAPELVKLLATKQAADGSWRVGGQFLDMQKRGVPDAQANALRVSLLALAGAPEAEAARTKAAALLQKKDEPTTMDSLLFRGLYAQSTGKQDEADALRVKIVKLQRRDGGWSSLIGENMSDPLATGQALYALETFAGPLRNQQTSDAIARAQKWLLKMQREDGGWPIDYTHISKVDRSDDERAGSRKNITMIYTFWGSSWATLGLLQGMPVKEETAREAAVSVK